MCFFFVLIKLCFFQFVRVLKTTHTLSLKSLAFIHSLDKPKCEEHKRPLEYFCKDDDILLCPDCYIGKTHKHHDVVKVEDILPYQLEQLRESCYEVAERTHLKISVALDEVNNEAEAIKEKGEKKKSEIQKYFRQIRKQLQQREQELLTNTDQIVMSKVASVNEQKEELEKTKTQLREQVRW